MPTPGDAPCETWTEIHWRAAASPARLQLLTALEGLGSSTVLALAEVTGRSAPSLYPHLEQLEEAGFVTSAEEAIDGRRQRVYRSGPACKLPPVDPDAAHGITRMARTAKLLMDDASRRLSRWAASAEGQRIGRGHASRVHATSQTTWLDDEQRAELNRLVERMNELLAQGRAARRGALHTVVLAHFPDPRGDGLVSAPPGDPPPAA